MNKKAFTVIELILAFSFVMLLALGMFSIITNYQEKQMISSIRNDMLAFQRKVVTDIQNDITDDVLERAEYCHGPMGDNYDCIVLYFKTGDSKKLEILTGNYQDEDDDPYEAKYIVYDGMIYEPKEKKFVTFRADFLLEETAVDDELVIYKIKIPIYHEDLEANYGIDITATGFSRQ